jgi:hypothetical protein
VTIGTGLGNARFTNQKVSEDRPSAHQRSRESKTESVRPPLNSSTSSNRPSPLWGALRQRLMTAPGDWVHELQSTRLPGAALLPLCCARRAHFEWTAAVSVFTRAWCADQNKRLFSAAVTAGRLIRLVAIATVWPGIDVVVASGDPMRPSANGINKRVRFHGFAPIPTASRSMSRRRRG